MRRLLGTCLLLLCLSADAQVNLTEITAAPPAASYWSGGRQIPFKTFLDRVGIQVHSGIPGSAVAEIAEIENLTMQRTFYRGIYELMLPGSSTGPEIDALARRLESDYSEIVKVAGFVIKSPTSSVPWLMTRRILIVFEAEPTDSQQEFLLENYPLEDFELLEGCETIFASTITGELNWNIAAIAGSIANEDAAGVESAHPNIVAPIIGTDEGEPGDPRLEQQWHHDNDGAGDATQDADIDSKEAWQITTGNNTNPLIAVIDSAFSIDHPDLEDNLWTDSDGITRGRDFDDYEHSSLLNSLTAPNPHGTAVAGIAGAIANNGLIGRGVCPDCRLLLLRHAGDTESATRAICFAIGQGAKVISNSWAPEGVFDATTQSIHEATDFSDIPVLFAMESVIYENRCDEWPVVDLSSLPNVIAVSSVTDQDARTGSGYGNCMDVLAPSRRGTINGIVTTSVFYDIGTSTLYNGVHTGFGGSSAATPMVAGTIGLMQDVNPNLTEVQIQRVLQDTADKIDPGENEGAELGEGQGFYDSESGFSMPPGGASTHGYGRINAFEAVSLIAPFDPDETDIGKRGHGSKDLLLRDHALDWGNTERPSSEEFTPSDPRETASIRHSPDIKIDVYPFDDTYEETPESFTSMSSEAPEVGQSAEVYVRLRNRGPETVDSASLKLHWTLASALPALPSDFWDQLPDDSVSPSGPNTWNSLPAIEITGIQYSGASAAGCPNRIVPDCLPLDDKPDDHARVIKFELPAMDWDESAGEGLSLLAVVHSDEDPLLAKLAAATPVNLNDVHSVVAWDNNVTMWSSIEGAPCCPDCVRILMLIALVMAFILILYIVAQWLNRNPVPAAIYIALFVLLLILLIIWSRYPCCFELGI